VGAASLLRDHAWNALSVGNAGLCLTLTTEGRRREHTVPVYASASLDLMPRRWSVSLFATNER